MRSLLDWLFAQGAERVFANTYTDNTRSVTLLKQLGFEEHGHYTAEQDASGKNLASCRMRLDRDVMSGIEFGTTSQPAWSRLEPPASRSAYAHLPTD